MLARLIHAMCKATFLYTRMKMIHYFWEMYITLDNVPYFIPLFYQHLLTDFLPSSFSEKKAENQNTARETQAYFYCKCQHQSLQYYNYHSVKIFRIRSVSGPYFPAFVLNTERQSESLCIQCKCGKISTSKTPNKDTFQAVYFRYFRYKNL